MDAFIYHGATRQVQRQYYSADGYTIISAMLLRNAYSEELTVIINQTKDD